MARSRKTTRTGKKTSAKQRKRNRQIQLQILKFFLLGCVLVSIWYVLRLPQFVIDSYIFEGNEVLSHEVLDSSIEVYVGGGRWWAPVDSALFTTKDRLEQFLFDTYPSIESITITRIDWSTYSIAIIEKEAEYLVFDGGNYFLADRRGYIFEPTAQHKEMRMFSSTLDNDKVRLRGNVMHDGDFGSFNDFLDTLDGLGLEVERVHFVNNLETIIVLKNQSKIVIRTFGEYDTYIQTLREILNYKEFDYQFNQGRFGRDIDYVNLRYGSKILYCYLTDPCQGNYDL